jgi:hypothetical protein
MQNSAVEIQFRLYATGRLPGAAGSSGTPHSGNGRLPRVTQVMALAIQFQAMIERGDARNYADLARLGCLTRERVSQIMELIWLAPDIQREILEFPPSGASRFPISEVALRRIASLLSWDAQRNQWIRLKVDHHLS